MIIINPKYRRFIISCGLVLVLLFITLIYLKNGNKITQLTLLYIIPIIFSALYFGTAGSISSSIGASVLFGVSTFLLHKGDIDPGMLFFDTFIQFGAFATIALIISYIAVSLKEKQKEVDFRLCEFNLIQEINKVLPSTNTLKKMLEEILTIYIKNIPAAQKGIIALVEPFEEKIEIAATYGIDRDAIIEQRLDLTDNHIANTIKTREHILTNDFNRVSQQKESLDQYSTLLLESGIKSILSVPITFPTQTLGAIALYNSKSTDNFSERDLQMMEIINEEIALAINNARSHQNTKRDLLEHQLLYRIGLLLTSEEDLDKILDTILDSALKITNTPAGSIALYDPKKQIFNLTITKGFSKNFNSIKKWKMRPGGLTSRIINERAPLNIANVSNEPSFDNPTMLDEGICSILATPLISGDKIIGIIYIDDFYKRDFTKDEISIMSLFANQATIAIDKAQMLKETKKMAITDGLTDCYNHRFFMNRLHEEIKRSERYNRPTSVIMIDLDFFKIYNDAYGHPQGDLALKKVAEIINKTTRSTDITARYGGDEFAIILPETTKSESINVAQKILLAIEEYPFPGKRALPSGNFTVSIGVACFPDDAKTMEGIIAAADDALYKAKKDSSSQVHVAKILRPLKK